MNRVRQASLGLRIASAMFALVSVAHLVRLWSDVEIRVGGYKVGAGVSVAFVLVAAGLSLWLRKLAVGLDHPPPPRPVD